MSLSILPLVDIVIPCLNGAKTIETAVQSCLPHAQIQNIYVGDNCSDDNLREVIDGISDPRVKYIRYNDRLPMLCNWLRLCKETSADFIKILPADDCLLASADFSELQDLLNSKRDLSLLVNKRLLNHPRPLITLLLNIATHFIFWHQSYSLPVSEIENYLSKSASNIFGEPSCVTFRGPQLRRLANSNYLLDKISLAQEMYPYAADLILYIFYLRSCPEQSIVFFSTQFGSVFSISKFSGTWRMRMRQTLDLIAFFSFLGLTISPLGHLKIRLRTFFRNAIFEIS